MSQSRRIQDQKLIAKLKEQNNDQIRRELEDKIPFDEKLVEQQKDWANFMWLLKSHCGTMKILPFNPKIHHFNDQEKFLKEADITNDELKGAIFCYIYSPAGRNPTEYRTLEKGRQAWTLWNKHRTTHICPQHNGQKKSICEPGRLQRLVGQDAREIVQKHGQARYAKNGAIIQIAFPQYVVHNTESQTFI